MRPIGRFNRFNFFANHTWSSTSTATDIHLTIIINNSFSTTATIITRFYCWS